MRRRRCLRGITGTPPSFGPDSEAYVSINNYGASDTIRIGARVTGAGTTSQSGYYVSVTSAGAWSILRIDNNSAPVTLASGVTQALASGDKLAIRIVGSVVTALHYTGGGGWAQVSVTTRAAIRSATAALDGSPSSTGPARSTTSAAAASRNGGCRSVPGHLPRRDEPSARVPAGPRRRRRRTATPARCRRCRNRGAALRLIDGLRLLGRSECADCHLPRCGKELPVTCVADDPRRRSRDRQCLHEPSPPAAGNSSDRHAMEAVEEVVAVAGAAVPALARGDRRPAAVARRKENRLRHRSAVTHTRHQLVRCRISRTATLTERPAISEGRSEWYTGAAFGTASSKYSSPPDEPGNVLRPTWIHSSVPRGPSRGPPTPTQPATWPASTSKPGSAVRVAPTPKAGRPAARPASAVVAAA